ncbi:MAG: PHP domain-containing protein [Candidatus Aenigmarchaeota archaeon]|nr:PHP domain-containing protein [Candidatus Aenigmarchaeota archaeon]
MHVHTKYSADCNMRPIDIINKELSTGIDCAAIADHNSFSSFKDFDKSGIKTIKGEEISTNNGHLIGLFLEEAVKSRDFFEACDEIHSQGAISILPHPYRAHKNPENLVGNVDVVEIFNARTSNRDNEKASLLADENKKTRICGSDAHFSSELGHGVIDVKTEDLQDARKLILKGKFEMVLTPSPFYVHPMTWLVKGIKLLSYFVKR